MRRTLLEKLDDSCLALTLKESVCKQIQRILSSRSNIDFTSQDGSFVSSFGVPGIVDQYATNSDNHQHYREVIRKKILMLEPRIKDVEVKKINHQNYRASCQLVLVLEEDSLEETFFFSS